MEGQTSNIDLIIWKKINGKFRCFMNNCNLTDNLKMKHFQKEMNIDYYDEVVNNQQTRIITRGKNKIFLQMIDEETLVEINIPLNDFIYFLSCISHKIRNPLTNIVSILTLLDEKTLDKTNKKYISMIKRSSYEIIGVANDLIDILNLYNGTISLQQEKVSIEKILNNCKNIMSNYLEDKKLYMNINIKEIPRIINVDHIRLTQILLNIIENSIEYTSFGGITVEVSNFSEEYHDETNCPFKYTKSKKPVYNLLFKIKDSGDGIPNEIKNYVDYILGTRPPDNTITNYPGFGLLISKQLCNLMGGNVWYMSVPNFGSIFYFNIICDGLEMS